MQDKSFCLPGGVAVAEVGEPKLDGSRECGEVCAGPPCKPLASVVVEGFVLSSTSSSSSLSSNSHSRSEKLSSLPSVHQDHRSRHCHIARHPALRPTSGVAS